jgi:hypothetical protein
MHNIAITLSDHKPQYYVKDNLSIVTWNVLMQCKLYDAFYNNGFGLIETKEQYINRLDKIVDQISSMNTVNIIALQECSKDLYNKLSTVLSSDWFIYHQGDRITCFDTKYMTVEIIEKIQVALGEQQRINGFHITTDNKEFDFFNQHFQWHQPGSNYYSKTVDILQNLVDTYNPSIITGDFNLNIMEIGLENCNVYAELNTTLCGKLDQDGSFSQHYETDDGFIVTGLL